VDFSLPCKSVAFEQIQDRYDVIVVGAGTAGSFFCANAPKNLSILLVDLRSFPREKPCGGLLVEESVGALAFLGLPTSVMSKPSPCDLIHVDLDNGFTLVQKNRLVNLDRKKFDHWLLTQGVKPNVDFSPETNVLSLEISAGGASVSIQKNGKHKVVSAEYLVGADGASSIVRKAITPKTVSMCLAVEDYVISKGKPVDSTYFFYSNDINDYYSWIVPKNGLLLIGTSFPLGTPQKMDHLFSFLKKNTGIWGTPQRRLAHMLSRPQSRDEFFLTNGKNVFLVGEAAGLVTSSTGEGMSYALRSSKALSEAFTSSDVAGTYIAKAAYLLEDLTNKIEKGKIFADKKMRKLHFENLIRSGKK
jgi:flavin-dependent dehydrogenase